MREARTIVELFGEARKVYGIDRLSFNSDILQKANWLEYDYGINRWRTIMSNLGFSNHFNHHNLREDGNYLEYDKTYMSIPNCQKVGGSFHYALDLPFIEEYLDAQQFEQQKFKIPGYDFMNHYKMIEVKLALHAGSLWQ